jgi:hypothetical protein
MDSEFQTRMAHSNYGQKSNTLHLILVWRHRISCMMRVNLLEQGSVLCFRYGQAGKKLIQVKKQYNRQCMRYKRIYTQYEPV